MMRTQQKRTRSLYGRILVVIRTTAIVHSLLLLASVSAISRSSGPGRSSCGQEFHHPDPESCASFLVLRVVCSSSPQVTVQRRLCPMGLLFHRLSKTCEFPWNADCRLSHSVSPSIPTRSLHSTINWNKIQPTVGIPSEGNTVGSRSSTGNYVGASTELVETTTDFKTLETITNHSDQSGVTVSPLFSVSEAGTINREEMTTISSEVTVIASSANENKSQIKTTASVAFKTLPTSETTIHRNDSVATMVVTTAGTSAADSTLGIGTKRVSEYSVRPTTVKGEFTYNTVLQTQFNSEGRSLQNNTTTPENSSRPTTMSNETIRRPVTISTVLAESSTSAEFMSTENETFFTSQNMDINIYSTALPEYSQENMTENVTTSVRSGTAETTSRIRTRNTSRGETTAVREITAGVEEYSHSTATAEIFTTQVMTKDNVTITVDENDSFTGVTTGYGNLTTKLAEDNATLVTRLLEVSQTMTTPDGISTYPIATEIAERTSNSVARTTQMSSNTTKTSNSEAEVPLEMPTV